jgi:hypothetical protein
VFALAAICSSFNKGSLIKFSMNYGKPECMFALTTSIYVFTELFLDPFPPASDSGNDHIHSWKHSRGQVIHYGTIRLNFIHQTREKIRIENVKMKWRGDRDKLKWGTTLNGL